METVNKFTNEEMTVINQYLDIMGLTFEEATKNFIIVINDSSIVLNKKSLEELYGEETTDTTDIKIETTSSAEKQTTTDTKGVKVERTAEEIQIEKNKARAIANQIKELNIQLVNAEAANAEAVLKVETCKATHTKLIDEKAETEDVKTAAIAVVEARTNQSKTNALVENTNVKIGMLDVEAADYIGTISGAEKVVDAIIEVGETVAKTVKFYMLRAKRFFNRINRNRKTEPVAFASKTAMVLSFLTAVGVNILAFGTIATVTVAITYYSALTVFTVAAIVLAYFSNSEIRIRSRLSKFAVILTVAFVAFLAASYTLVVTAGTLVSLAAFVTAMIAFITIDLYLTAAFAVLIVGLVRMASTKVSEHFANENTAPVYGPVEATSAEVAPATVKA